MIAKSLLMSLLACAMLTSTACKKSVLEPAMETQLLNKPDLNAIPAGQSIEPQIPTMAFVGVIQSETTLARFEEMRAAGITHCYSVFSDANALEKAMDIALKANIKMFVMCPELKTDPERTVKRFMNHGALAGYYLGDEPSSILFSSLKTWVNRIKALDSKHPCYVNLLPNYVTNKDLGTSSYQEYVKQFIDQVPVQLVSFDNYPIIGSTNLSVRERWYENLETISSEARKAEKPFWAFALTVAHGPYPVPTLAALRLQVFTNLAYGAQGIQFFSYWTINDPGGYNFNNAPIALDGTKTKVYYDLQAITAEIKSLSGVFLGAKLLSVAHTGTVIPLGTKRLTALPAVISVLKTEGIGAVVSILERNNEAFLVVVNRDFTKSMKLTIKCASVVNRVSKDGSSAPVSGKTENITVAPGDVTVFKWIKT